jgi:hypothetical protein
MMNNLLIQICVVLALAGPAAAAPPDWYLRPPASSRTRAVATGRGDTRLEALMAALGQLALSVAPAPAGNPSPSVLRLGPAELSATLASREGGGQLAVSLTLAEEKRSLAVRYVRDDPAGKTARRRAVRLEWVAEEFSAADLFDLLRRAGITVKTAEAEGEVAHALVSMTRPGGT